MAKIKYVSEIGVDTYYYLATDKYLYEIQMITASGKQSVKDTTEQIFNNLLFLD
jgi:hypothetical protein